MTETPQQEPAAEEAEVVIVIGGEKDPETTVAKAWAEVPSQGIKIVAEWPSSADAGLVQELVQNFPRLFNSAVREMLARGLAEQAAKEAGL